MQRRSKKVTVNLDVDLDEQAKAAFWLVHDSYANYSAWVSEALREKIEKVKEEAGIDELPARPGGPLRTGRPFAPASPPARPTPRGRGSEGA